jgi:hypothetical protein
MVCTAKMSIYREYFCKFCGNPIPLHKYRFCFLETVFCLFHVKGCKQAGFFYRNVKYLIMENTRKVSSKN